MIVRDIWFTGFDAPCFSTMYLDKPIRGHGLMQTFARVNRVFRDKHGGLVVDYLGLADELKRALATIDWTIRDNVRAQLRVYVKRILRKYGYPPDKQERATRTVLEQAEVLSEAWAIA